MKIISWIVDLVVRKMREWISRTERLRTGFLIGVFAVIIRQEKDGELKMAFVRSPEGYVSLPGGGYSLKDAPPSNISMRGFLNTLIRELEEELGLTGLTCKKFRYKFLGEYVDYLLLDVVKLVFIPFGVIKRATDKDRIIWLSLEEALGNIPEKWVRMREMVKAGFTFYSHYQRGEISLDVFST